MKINVTNEQKITEAFDAVNAKVRNADHTSVKAIINIIEKSLTKKGLPKNLWSGLAFWCDINAQKFPNAYKWTPESTQFILTRFPSGWFVTRVTRTSCGTKMIAIVTPLTDKQKEAIVNKFYSF